MQATAQRDPRLKMGHLLIWIVGCAVGFTAYRSIAPHRLMLGPRGRALVAGYTPAMGIAFGTILTGCGLLAHHRWRGGPSCPSQPGHWLLLFGLAAAAADLAAVAAYQYRASQDPDYSSFPSTPYLAQFVSGPVGFWPVMLHHAVGWTAGALVALGFLRALRGRLERHWFAVFLVFFILGAALAVAHVTSAVLFHYPVDTRRLDRLLVHAYGGSVVIGAAAILSAVDKDRRSGTTGDGLHRLGVGAWLTIAAIQVVMYCLFIVLY